VIVNDSPQPAEARHCYLVDRPLADRAEAIRACGAVLDVLRPALRLVAVDALTVHDCGHTISVWLTGGEAAELRTRLAGLAGVGGANRGRSVVDHVS